jgi:hypothetical protein
MWLETGSILNKKKQCPRGVLTEQILEGIQVRMEMSPRKLQSVHDGTVNLMFFPRATKLCFILLVL